MGQLIAVYAGYFLHVDKQVYFDNMTIDDQEDVHKNWLHFNETFMIDVKRDSSKLPEFRANNN